MTVIICVDDDLGMMFNGRRQSRDAAVYKRIFDIFEAGQLMASPYSKALFEGFDVIYSENFLSAATSDDVCFAEDADIHPYINDVDKLVLYYWNRKYPSDKKLQINFDDFVCQSEYEFKGNSHEKITEKIFVRRSGI